MSACVLCQWVRIYWHRGSNIMITPSGRFIRGLDHSSDWTMMRIYRITMRHTLHVPNQSEAGKSIARACYYHIQILVTLGKMVAHYFRWQATLRQCSLTWSPKQNDGISRVHNSTAQLVTCTREQEHITPVLNSLHWLPPICWLH